MTRVPEYVDGILNIYKIEHEKSGDYPVEVLVPKDISLWFREISVFDRTRYEFEQGGKEITMKIRIPQYHGIDSNCVCIIEGIQHLVYNATHIQTKDGFKETELTLIRPEREVKIIG